MEGSVVHEHISESRPAAEPPEPSDLAASGCHESGYWFGVGSVPSETRQGWKLYISATPSNFARLVHAVAAVFARHGIPFKYVRSVRILGKANAGLFGFSQVGKNVVAYLGSGEGLGSFFAELKAVLHDLCHCGPLVPRVPRAWPGVNVFYRYGGYTERTIIIGGECVVDDRDDPARHSQLLPDDPIRACCQSSGCSRELSGAPSLLSAYPVMKVICRSGKGGVFEAKDKKTDASVIAKLGLRFGAQLPDGRDGAHFVAWEASMYRRMQSLGLGTLVPGLIAFAEESDASVLILEKLEGRNLAEARESISSDAMVLRDALHIIRRLHAHDFVLGDAKITNFIAGPGGVRLVDLESMKHVHQHRSLTVPASFHVISANELDVFDADLVHFLASILFEDTADGMFCTIGRSLCLNNLLGGRKIRDAWDAFALREIRSIVGGRASAGESGETRDGVATGSAT